MKSVWRYDHEVQSDKEYCNCGSVMDRQTDYIHRHYDEFDYPLYTVQIFKILICPSCESVSVVLHDGLGNEIESDEIKQRGDPPGHKYRRKVLYAPAKRRHISIPHSVGEVANQAEAVLASSPRACFILCRATLEEICNDFKIPTQKEKSNGKSIWISLHDRLKCLFEQEKLPEDLRDILQGIKNLGNEGAHTAHEVFRRKVRAEDAEHLLILINYILERLYVDKARQEESKKTLTQLKSKLSSSDS